MLIQEVTISLFQTTRELLVNKIDLQAITLVGPIREDPVPDPLAVLHLDIQQLMMNQLWTRGKSNELDSKLT